MQFLQLIHVGCPQNIHPSNELIYCMIFHWPELIKRNTTSLENSPSDADNYTVQFLTFYLLSSATVLILGRGYAFMLPMIIFSYYCCCTFVFMYNIFRLTYSLVFLHASYYVAAPLSLASSCIPEAAEYFQGQVPEFVVKGRARMPDLVIDSSSLLQPLLKLGWTQWIGAVIFIWGSLHQIRCHAILVSICSLMSLDILASFFLHIWAASEIFLKKKKKRMK